MEEWLCSMRWRLVFVIFLVSCSSSVFLLEAAGLGYAVVTFTTQKGQVRVKAEVAETPSERGQGLMFRTVLAENAGMLFVFDHDQPLTFWMMNTSIRLDGIFISSQLLVVFVAENLKPCPPSNCQDPQSFSSGTPAMYVLEVNAGFSGKNGIKLGTKVSINQSPTTSTTSIIAPETTGTSKSTTTTVGSSSSASSTASSPSNVYLFLGVGLLVLLLLVVGLFYAPLTDHGVGVAR
jgi:uncharacterized membrane protein (UPF0127 family)